jgi:hypothetical protein
MDARKAIVTVDPPDVSALGAPAYSNVAHVSFTPYDFRITFSLLTASLDSGALMSDAPRAVAEVVIPAASVGPLADLLRGELDRFIEAFGPPRPGLVREPASAAR